MKQMINSERILFCNFIIIIIIILIIINNNTIIFVYETVVKTFMFTPENWETSDR